MNLESVPIADIEVPAVRVTSHMPDEIKALFSLSVQAAGVLQPVHLLRDNGRLVLVDGLHRLQEAKARGETVIDANVAEGDLKAVLLQNLATSGLRGRPKNSEMRRVIGALYDEYGMDAEEIRLRVGLTQEYVDKCLWVNRATPEVQDALDDDLIGLAQAALLARVEKPASANFLLAQCIQYRWTVDMTAQVIKDVDRFLATQETPAPTGKQREALLPHCRLCDAEVAMHSIQVIALCPNCYGRAWASLSPGTPSTP